ncbi:kinesin family member 3 [Plasmopara halstedii]|uniref:Kinesin family member 3 n=1 Tax=Plasmopara halstedii TaxID=4781 RepID=A0A0P1B6G5_PLAHL|nr:kinesin family member 3 [Plasmopara halstedii]CEG50415.1 kinesin family member 3 [Plasmopara halstedii]|eukprot:XP_024586784.1 kinesin family member 3 [Plasmopara halstedii]
MALVAESRAGIRVCARFRPQNKLEQKHEAVNCVRLEDGTAAHVHSESRGASDDHTFTFDQVFGVTSAQLDVYKATAKPLVESALRGYNCTCFVYGQTGSGKTFSMEGVPGDKDYEGIIPRVMADIFDGIQNMQADLEFIVRVSYVEIYMEKIRDLLKPSSANLNVRESRERGVWIAGATEICCASVEEMQAVMRLGGSNRVVSSTRMNCESSRSHSVFIITIEQRNTATGSMRSGKLFLVDLAGSEKVGKTRAQGHTLKEAQHINKSLSALGSVMNALTSGNTNAHIPYRDSKLTRLLQDSLGGNSETTLLVCASCSSYNCEETISTLRFGTRAKNIKNKPKINQERTVAEYKILVAEKDKRIATLEALLCEANASDADQLVESSAQKQLELFIERVEELEDNQASKSAEISSLEDRCIELEARYKDLEEKERETSLIASRSEEVIEKLAFSQSELEAKAKECEELHRLLKSRRRASTGINEKAAIFTETVADSEVFEQKEAVNYIDGKLDDRMLVDDVLASMAVVADQSSANLLVSENEFLRQHLTLKSKELEACTLRVDELTKTLSSCRTEYNLKIAKLQEKLSDFDAHIRAPQPDSLVSKAKMLRSVRGGSQPTPISSRQNERLSTKDQGKTGPRKLLDDWKLDDEIFPVAPIDMESEVVKRLIRNMPELSRKKITKWLSFVLEGRDIRSNFHPEILINGISEETNQDMRRLIVPLLKNRYDLKVQSYIRTRYVRVSDLKITLDHKHQNVVRLEATDSDSDGNTEDNTATHKSSLLWAKGHLFYGPKSDASSPSVLHASRVLLPSKDRFMSEPVDLGVSVTESKSMMEAPRSMPTLNRNPSLPFDSYNTMGSSPSSGGVFSRLRSKAGVATVLDGVKTRLNARYHKNHVHENAFCDGCGMSPIVGGKWKCNTCDNFELCDGCYAAGIHGFEVSNELCRRVEQLAVQKHNLLGEYPELLELVRCHICHDNVIQFRRVVEWLCAIVSGTRTQQIHHKMIVKNGLHPDIRARLVAQLGALASERADISLQTEWFVELTPEEEAAGSATLDTMENGSVELNGDKFTPTSSNVRLETLRMYLMDASSLKPEPSASAALLDLLEPTAKMDVEVAGTQLSRHSTSEISAHDRRSQLVDLSRKQSLDLPIYGSQHVKSVTQLNM